MANEHPGRRHIKLGTDRIITHYARQVAAYRHRADTLLMGCKGESLFKKLMG